MSVPPLLACLAATLIAGTAAGAARAQQPEEKPPPDVAAAIAALDPANRPLNEQLLNAAIGGDVGKVRELIGRGADPNARIATADPKKTSGILTACIAHGQVAAAKELIARGADVNRPDPGGTAPLHLAAAVRSPELVAVLLEKGALPNAPDGDGDTPLHSAATLGTPEMVRILLDKGAKLNAQNRKRRTPLMQAALLGSPETVRLLLSRGADPNVIFRDPISGWVTALNIARLMMRQDVIRLLDPVTKVGRGGGGPPKPSKRRASR